VIFANDPHIGFQPGTWYEPIVTPEFELYGCYLAGHLLYWDITGIMHTATMFQNMMLISIKENSQIMTINIKHNRF
jgi:penicillin amidase